MEVLVVIAIILVLAAIIFPVYRSVQMRANKAQATASIAPDWRRRAYLCRVEQ